MCTLANQISAASIFELITLKKIRIDFLKYALTDLFDIFCLQFEAILLHLNAFDEIDLFGTINRDIANAIYCLVAQLCMINGKLKDATSHVTFDEWHNFEHRLAKIKNISFLDLKCNFHYITKDLEVVE